MDSINARIAEELGVRPQQVAAAVALLDEGSTVPFIARYRKEVTGSLDDTQLRTLEERLRYLRELDERRASILSSIEEQGKLTPELAREIKLADTKTRLEDLYLPYKQKRRTKGQIALEAGLGELADALFGNPALDPESEAARFVDEGKGFADVKAVLDGAKYILMERFAEDADLLARLRGFLKDNATLSARLVAGKEQEGAKFSDYFEHDELLKGVPSHRALAIFRGRNEGILSASLKVGDELPGSMHPCEGMIAERFGIEARGRAADKWLAEVVRWTWKVKLYTHLETDLLGELREAAESEAINVFARNLHDLLLSAPAGPRCTLGLDPGLRTGCKVAVVDATGKLLDTATVYPHEPRCDWDGALHALGRLVATHGVSLIAIGNGTASRETDKLAADLMKRLDQDGLQRIVVSEAGASVYSASEFASKELPDLDVSLRGAVSIARRLQDPLAELVKIDPKSIGVGQYQHDVQQSALDKKLDEVVESCVNGVGVELNTASASLLSRVAGLGASVAKRIV
ncbi:MAG TPA: Tex family protein, partial [Pseudomonas sp.]